MARLRRAVLVKLRKHVAPTPAVNVWYHTMCNRYMLCRVVQHKQRRPTQATDRQPSEPKTQWLGSCSVAMVEEFRQLRLQWMGVRIAPPAVGRLIKSLHQPLNHVEVAKSSIS